MGFKEWTFDLRPASPGWEAGHSLVSDGAWGLASLRGLLIRSLTPTPQILGPGDRIDKTLGFPVSTFPGCGMGIMA